ncbi:protein kinase [Nocardia rhizosphaerihabitans]|uniref:protein kinase domain-containing protein n=1 Tax=Nocardia rhizosphaerihabitans TaxID=1691570 RepID=UPI00366BC196
MSGDLIPRYRTELGGALRLRPGSTVGGYVLTEMLGGGAYGAVYLAKHPRLERNVALKVLYPGYAADPKVRIAFDREATLIASLDHPNIVAVYDRNDPEDEHLWLSMRPVAGGDLAALINAEPEGLDPQRVARLIVDAARGLDHAHRNGVLHRDVKPANILVEQHPDGERAFLTDFGIARALDATVTATGVTATLAYTAPERFARQAVDHRADVYSLGCTLFHLLTGHTPFRTTDPASTIAAHLSEPPPSPRDLRPALPAYLDIVITTALSKTPTDRYSTCSELAENVTRAVTATTYAPTMSAPHNVEVATLTPAADGDTGAVSNHGLLLESLNLYDPELATLLLAADSGDTTAMNKVGRQHEEHGALTEARVWYRRAANAGHTGAMYNLGVLLEEHAPLQLPVSLGSTVPIPAGKQPGDSEEPTSAATATNDLGDIPELTEAENWYRRAANAGHTGAMYNLAVLLEERGQQTDAENWYRRAADAEGHPATMYNLGNLLKRRGKLGEAENWHRRAANAGHTGAVSNLGVLLAGRGEQTEAEGLYRRAAHAGHTGAMRNLAALLEKKGELTDAENWYRRAADADGHPTTMYNLGNLLKGRGKLGEAENWYRNAAVVGHTGAMYSLGALLEGRGERTDAENWYRNAAVVGHTGAMYSLGALLEGRGERTDAENWYRRADRRREPPSREPGNRFD